LKKIKSIPIDEPVSVDEGYDVLSAQAFSVWIRIMVASDKELTGYKNLSKALGFSRLHTMNIIKELTRRGFVSVHKESKPPGRSIISIRKRCLLSGRNKFIKLS
jgi:hypothetical protein